MLLKRLALRRPMSQKFQLWFRVPRSAPSASHPRSPSDPSIPSTSHYTPACDASRLERSRSLTALSSIRPLSFPGVIAGFATGKGRKAEFSGAFSLLTRAIHVPITRSQTPASRRRTLYACSSSRGDVWTRSKWRRALDSEACMPSFTRPEHAVRKFRTTKHPGAAEMTRFPPLPRSTSNQSIFNLYSKVLFNTSLS